MNVEQDWASMLAVAIREARTGLAEGGLPIGAAMFNTHAVRPIRHYKFRNAQSGYPSRCKGRVAMYHAHLFFCGHFFDEHFAFGGYFGIG